jgi:hypothetical protein
MKKILMISEKKMTNNSNNQSEKEISDIIEILEFLNYDGTVNLYNVDFAEAFE